ncbi:MAG: hypothetical protein K2H98_09995 [Duncaniella sp.]|nr:hypothetical protein [Duncaniella sp.]
MLDEFAVAVVFGGLELLEFLSARDDAFVAILDIDVVGGKQQFAVLGFD